MQMRAREAGKNANTQQELVDLLLAETVVMHFVVNALYMHCCCCCRMLHVRCDVSHLTADSSAE